MRQYISEPELLDLLNAELAREGGCDHCRFSGPLFRRDEPDDSGCNWKTHAVILTCSGRTPGGCRSVAYRVLDLFGRRYNLTEA